MNNKISELYNQDYHAWLNATINSIKQRDLSNCDFEHIVEELESMSNKDIRELYSRFVVLIGHLLKCQYQHEKISSGWLGSIREQRRKIELLLLNSPSLRPKLEDIIISDYVVREAMHIFTNETGLKPVEIKYTLEQLLDNDFIPNKRYGQEESE